MEHAKKMKLVPVEWVEQTKSPRGELKVTLEGIDSEMQKILSSKLPADVKLKLYQNALGSYIREHERIYDPVEVRIQADKPSMADNNTIVASVSEHQQATAERLLSHLSQSSRFSWNSENEILIDQQRLPGTNIFQLVRDFVSPGRKGTKKPLGCEEFAKLLRDTKVPREAVKNYQRWLLIQPVTPGATLEDVPRAQPVYSPQTRSHTRNQTGGRRILKKWQTFRP